MYIVIAVLVFGILIAVHELGHFTAAKTLGVKVNEFAIGMGPAVFKRQGKETMYTLRILPIGGFCAMEGEDGDSEDPRAFTRKPIWKRLVILIAGSLMNFLVGFIIVLAIFMGNEAFTAPVLGGFMSGYPHQGENGLMAGDRIVSINGERIYTYGDVSLFLSRSNGLTADLVIIRDGKKLVYDDFPIARQEYQTENGTEMKIGLYFTPVKATIGQVLKYTWFETFSFVRMVRLGLSDLLSGAVGVNQLSGPVGIVALINDVGSASENVSAAVRQVAYLCAFIAVNLALMNLLPIPALDGGRIFFMLITFILEKILRRKVNPKIEGYIHGAGLILLLGLMVFVMYNDISKLL
ncbi:MAG: RIP metalloprotease RseP [Clostridiales bacterium]|nr:RIP metalloprotease RseP [Clostridiales bacterium]